MKKQKKKKYHEPIDHKTIKSIQDIGHFVQQVRKENQLTQHQTAQLCGVTPKFLSELETGKSKHFSLQLTLHVLQSLGIQLECKRRKIT